MRRLSLQDLSKFNTFASGSELIDPLEQQIHQINCASLQSKNEELDMQWRISGETHVLSQIVSIETKIRDENKF